MPRKKLPDKKFKWTPSLAYAIGLLATDGNLSKNGRQITMTSSDVQLLKTFKKCLNINNKISETFNNGWAKKRIYRVHVCNVQFYRWLLKIGLFPAKTYTINELKIPNKYFRDFLRGHLDGDGSILTYKDYYNTYKNPKYIYVRLWVRFMSASEKHVDWIRKNILNLLSIRGHKIGRKAQKTYQTTTMWILKFGKKDSMKLLYWMYYNRNVPCLIRKRKIAEKFI